MQSLFRLLVLFAVLLMPVGMAPVSAASHSQTMAGMPMEHCPDQTPADHSKSAFADCTMACSAALPALETTAADPLPPAKSSICLPVMRPMQGLHPQTATPPPKTA